MLFLLLFLCNIVWSRVLWYLQHCSFCWASNDFHSEYYGRFWFFKLITKKSVWKLSTCIMVHPNLQGKWGKFPREKNVKWKVERSWFWIYDYFVGICWIQ
jgi:hypothetical protein